MTRRNGRDGTKYNRRGYAKPAGSLAAPAYTPKHPPNRSGDPQGYNTARFPSLPKVWVVISSLGYPTSTNPKEIYVKFQRDYNLVHKYAPTKVPGTLKVDGVPGKHTLNGLEWASHYGKIMPKSWMHYVKKFRYIESQSKPKPGGVPKPGVPGGGPKPKPKPPAGPRKPGRRKPKMGGSRRRGSMGKRKLRRRSR